MPEYLLDGYRALDLTDEIGFLCGKILAQLGVDVIKVEKPGGDTSRNIPPYYHNEPDPEKSLYWFSYNTNKRGITLDLEKEKGRELFRRLIKTSDFIIESFPPGYLNKLGLGYEELSRLNPKIIVTSITPFGQDGPYSNLKASDLIIDALGAMIAPYGDPDRAPTRISIPQAYMHAGVKAAEGSMLADYYRGISGEGQHVDISAMESVLRTSMIPAITLWEYSKEIIKRGGNRYALGPNMLQNIWECKDGYITFQFLGGMLGARTNKAMTEWMDSEGLAPEFMKQKDWANWDLFLTSQKEVDELQKAIIPFFKNHTKEELHNGAIKRGMMLYRVADSADTLTNEQLRERNFWETIEHEALNDHITYPGAFAKTYPKPLKALRRAPNIGEHNREIYVQELGISENDITALQTEKII